MRVIIYASASMVLGVILGISFGYFTSYSSLNLTTVITSLSTLAGVGLGLFGQFFISKHKIDTDIQLNVNNKLDANKKDLYIHLQNLKFMIILIINKNLSFNTNSCETLFLQEMYMNNLGDDVFRIRYEESKRDMVRAKEADEICNKEMRNILSIVKYHIEINVLSNQELFYQLEEKIDNVYLFLSDMDKIQSSVIEKSLSGGNDLNSGHEMQRIIDIGQYAGKYARKEVFPIVDKISSLLK